MGGFNPTTIQASGRSARDEANVDEVANLVAYIVSPLSCAGTVLRVDSIQAAATTGEEAEAERAYIASELARAISTDAFAAYTAALTLEAGITIDQSAIDAIHASLP